MVLEIPKKLGTSSVIYDVGLFKGEDNTAAAEGFFAHVNVDRATRRPLKIHPQTKMVLTKLMNLVG